MDYAASGCKENYKMKVSLITPTPRHLITRKRTY